MKRLLPILLLLPVFCFSQPTGLPDFSRITIPTTSPTISVQFTSLGPLTTTAPSASTDATCTIVFAGFPSALGAISGVTGYEYSMNGTVWVTSMTGLTNGTYAFHVRLTGSAAGSYPGTINVTGTGATSRIITLSGTVSAASSTAFATIVVDHTKVPNTDQTNFPVTVSGVFPALKSAANGGTVTDINNITFSTDNAGVSLLSWEVEYWNPATGQIVAHVLAPSLSHNTDYTFYLRYGVLGFGSYQGGSTGAAWNSAFKGVWHMKETLTASGQTVADATSNGLNLTSAGTWISAQQIDGQVGGALSLSNSSGDYLTFTSQAITGAYTIEGWVNTSIADQTSFVWANLGNNDNVNFYNGLARQFFSSTDKIVDLTTTPTNTWTYVAITRSGSTLNLYHNGSLTVTNSNGANITISSLGKYNATVTASIKYDEMRYSNAARSADWIATSYNNQSSPSTFYSISF